MTAACNHIDPTTWDKVRGTDGQTRMFCPGCGQFKGYFVPTTPPKKQPAKPEKVK